MTATSLLDSKPLKQQMQVSVSVSGRAKGGAGVSGEGEGRGSAAPAERFWRGGLLKGTQHVHRSDGISMIAVELLLVPTS